MRNLLKKIILPFSIIPTTLAPLAVIACTDQLHDVKKDISTTDLGYVEDLGSAAIRKAFIAKNPKVKGFFVPKTIKGDSHQAVFRMRNGYYDRQQIKITYYSKIDFDDNNQKDYQLTKENNRIVVSFRILAEIYDETVDPKITDYYNQDLLKYASIEPKIDKINKTYQFTITLKSNVDSLENFSSPITFRYWADPEYEYGGSNLVTINLEIKTQEFLGFYLINHSQTCY